VPTIEYWIQIENRPWDVGVNDIDRMTGRHMAATPGGGAPQVKALHSPETGVTRNRLMYRPLGEDALILRRYLPNWSAPDDRRVNPWDMNEKDPSDNGTMGTIPGPVIECNVGDDVRVHFRNRDARPGKTALERAHSLHPHGFVFETRWDGAYPLSPEDPDQPVGAEGLLWTTVDVSGNKKGDRVPGPDLVAGGPGGTFTYTWATFGWPTTAGVWLYHDHAACDMENVGLGAIGIIVIHNNADPQDLPIQLADLPEGSVHGSPLETRCFPFPFEVAVLPGQLERAFEPLPLPGPHPGPDPDPMPPMEMEEDVTAHHARKRELEIGPPVRERLVELEGLLVEFDPKREFFRRICRDFIRTPPDKALYLLLFHDLAGVSMCINGRKYLGNTPTLIAGQQTKMRFGVVGMGSDFHTFHLHGHRWIIPGPHGSDPGTIQGSPLDTPVSQFEDTRVFGPANSFVFSVDESSGFMRASPGRAKGEWHLHCHVLGHMMDGMMGSLLIVDGGELASGLRPQGRDCHAPDPTPTPSPNPTTATVHMKAVPLSQNPSGFAFDPLSVTVAPGAVITFANDAMAPHSIVWDTPTPGGAAKPPGTSVSTMGLTSTMLGAGTFPYHCGVHGPDMHGTIVVA
jgi:FtsP/CotA-like multicopper oxidase with cupredoxin domain/plastocyanin